MDPHHSVGPRARLGADPARHGQISRQESTATARTVVLGVDAQ
jgi:hypothetical protein